MNEVRIDKYLWAIRVYKTRSEAAEACKAGKVAVNGNQAKSSKDIKKGDTIGVRRGAVHYKYLVVEPLERRVSASLVESYATDITPETELEKLAAPNETVFLKRDKGAGRPTKKERREIDKLLG